MRRDRAGYAMVAIAASTWGTWSLFFRRAERLAPISAALEATIVLTVVGLAPLPWALGRRAGPTRPARAFAGLAALGLLDAGNSLCFFGAMQKTSIAVAVLTHYLAPLLVAIAAPRVLGERARASTWASLGVALAGLCLLLEPWRSGASATLDGATLGLASAVFYATSMLLNKRLSRWFTAPELISWHAPVALVVLALFVPHGGFAIGLAPLAWLVSGALVVGAGAAVLFVYGLARIPASHASVLTLLEPLVAVVVAAVAWGEIPGPAAGVGAALLLAAAWGVVRGS